MRPRSLILAGHGSMAAPDSNKPLFDLAERIKKLDKQSSLGNFEIVTPAFLNGQPEMTTVLDDVDRGRKIPIGDVVIVPIMTSQGYYLRKLPGKFAENLTINDYRVFMSPVLGIHPSIASRFAEKITGLVSKFALVPNQTTVVIIGHGTRRNATSGQSTFDLTNRLKQILEATGLKFSTGFLDQDPTAELAASQIDTPNTLVIPFLVSRGPHTTDDVPTAFGLPTGPDLKFPVVMQTQQGVCIYGAPLATYPGIDHLCLEIAIETLATGEPINFGIDDAPSNDSAHQDLETFNGSAQ